MSGHALTYRDAAALLIRCGWQQDHLGDGDGPHCMSGAILEVATEMRGVWDLPCEVIGEVSIPAWNDKFERTAAEVIFALDAAYVLALQEEGIEPGDVL